MSTTRKQQIRPRFVDLAEFDDQDFAPASGHDDQGRNAFNWPPAATVVRKPPPTIKSSKDKSKPEQASGSHHVNPTNQNDANTSNTPISDETISRSKVVRIAPESMNQVRQIPASNDKPPSRFAQRRQAETTQGQNGSDTGFSFGPSHATSSKDDSVPSRFQLDLDQQPGNSMGPNPLGQGFSIVGEISERPTKPSKSLNTSKPKAQSGSRFVVGRRMDEDLKSEEQSSRRTHTFTPSQALEQQEPGTGFPIVPRRDRIDPILPPVSTDRSQPLYNEDITSVEPPSVDPMAQQAAKFVPQSLSSQSKDDDEDEEWFDEQGRPMSAFRKARLLRQGSSPPATRKKGPERGDTHDDPYPSYIPDPTRDPGGGADPDSITAMLASVSRENDKTVKSMNKQEIDQEIQSLESLFGKDVLEALISRRKTQQNPATKENQAGSLEQPSDSSLTFASTPSPAAVPSGAAHVRPSVEEDEQGPIAIKRKYFPGEPDRPNPALEWMMPQPVKTKSDGPLDPRFDFNGKVLGTTEMTDETYISALHHHGDDQDTPGYTVAELLHLAKNNVAAQRQLALNVLGRICQNYPSQIYDRSKLLPIVELSSENTVDPVHHLDANSGALRARILLSARWLLDDRHFTVRSAALRCLASVLGSGPSGAVSVSGAQLETDWVELGKPQASSSRSRQDRSKMTYEQLVQSDSNAYLFESGFFDLCLERTSHIVTSSWDAEMVLEIMWRVASCSAEKTIQLLGDENRKARDLIIELGLRGSWPPVELTSSTSTSAAHYWPSLYAIRLLHLGVLSDRQLAKTMVVEGTIDSLLKYVLLPPWKLEVDLVQTTDQDDAGFLILRAYQQFGACLDVFLALGRYGFYAAIVGRAWEQWQQVGQWALQWMQTLKEGKYTPVSSLHSAIIQAKVQVAEKALGLLETWTVCAQDPHQLMNHHDVTWTQARDWVDISIDTLKKAKVEEGANISSKQKLACIIGRACGHLSAWIECAKGKELELLFRTYGEVEAVVEDTAKLVEESLALAMTKVDTVPIDQYVAELASICHSSTNLLRLISSLETVTRLTQRDGDRSEGGPLHSTYEQIRAGMKTCSWQLLSCQKLWQDLASSQAHATGLYAYKRYIVHLIVVALEVQTDSADVAESLAILPVLSSANQSLAAEIVSRVTLTLTNSETEKVLRPFLEECIFGRKKKKKMAIQTTDVQVDPSPENLLRYNCLFYSEVDEESWAETRGRDKTEEKKDGSEKREEEEEVREEKKVEEEEELDPITKTRFWRCPANGLPLRSDWPLLALDDLLHSANTAVFNRPDNLDPDWQANERDIVENSLRLAISVFQCLFSSYQSEIPVGNVEDKEQQKSSIMSALPSAQQIWLAVMKVFMLEKDQPETFTTQDKNQKTTGALTGRDLFREPAISSLLSQLLDMADQLAPLSLSSSPSSSLPQLPASNDFDQWTSLTLGSKTRFYEFITDLIGLYDSISFADTNFARCIVLIAVGNGGSPTFNPLPIDFRKLIWNDYLESLHTIPTHLIFPLWYLNWIDENNDMFQTYCHFLLSSSSERNDSIIYTSAIHHCIAKLDSISDSNSDCKIWKMAISLLSSKDNLLLQKIFEYHHPIIVKENLAISRIQRYQEKFKIEISFSQ